MRATALAFPAENLVGWGRSLVAFLVEKERRSGSQRPVEGYSRMLQDFFGRVRKMPDDVTSQEIFVWAPGVGATGKEPSPITSKRRPTPSARTRASGLRTEREGSYDG